MQATGLEMGDEAQSTTCTRGARRRGSAIGAFLVPFLVTCASCLSASLAVAAAAPTADDALKSLQRFFNQVDSYTAAFHQDRLDEGGKPVEESTGRLWIQRPNKFRWNYDKPYRQQIVGDGGESGCSTRSCSR